MPAPRAARPRRSRLRPRAEKARLKRERILDAALEEFSRKGFAAARMEDVAQRAGVGKGTVYLYFDDKEALFEGLVHEMVIAPLAGLLEMRPAPGESVGQILRRAIPPAIARVARTRVGDLLRLLIGEGVRFPKLAESYRRLWIEPMTARMRELLAQAHAQGELASEALVKFPQLVVAPALVAIIWTGLFGRALPLDVQAMLGAHLDILFPRPSRPRS
jgi:AcrR family transcriptional regulator